MIALALLYSSLYMIIIFIIDIIFSSLVEIYGQLGRDS